MTLPKLPEVALDDINHRRRHRETTNLILNHQHDDSRVRTAAEIAAGVTPVNYAYSANIYDVRRFGALGDGVTDDAPAFQRGIDVVRKNGGTLLIPMPPVAYLLLSALNGTTNSSAGDFAKGFTIRGEGNVIAATLNVNERPAIIFKHTGHGFDCSGTFGIHFENLTIGTDASTYPKTCFFLARGSTGGSQIHRFTNCRVYGAFSKAVVYNYGSEDEVYTACQFFNIATDSGAKVIQWTANNIQSLTSTFITIATGVQSCIDHLVLGGQYMLQSSTGTNAASDVFDLDGAHSTKIIGPWCRSALDGAGDGRSIVHCDLTNSPSNNVLILGITGEHSTNVQNYGVVFDNVAKTPSYWTIDSCLFPNASRMIAAGANVTCDNFHVRALSNASVGGGIDFLGTLQNSHIDELGNNITIGTSSNNVLNVSISNLTVTTRSGDYWAGSGTQTWTPGTAGLPHGGTLTVGNTTIHYQGREVVAMLTLSDTVSITCAAGQLITGLPRAISIGSGQVTVNNDTDAISIGTGSVTGTSIKLPAFTVGVKNVSIVARYFVAT